MWVANGMDCKTTYKRCMFILLQYIEYLGECKDFMEEYMKCLQQNKNSNSKCRSESKRYLECRMDRYVDRQLDNVFLWVQLSVGKGFI